MTPLVVFLLGCLTVFFSCVETSFTELMRLSLRLRAERGGKNDRLGRYLEDPRKLFIPVRLLITTCTLLAWLLLARVTDVDSLASVIVLVLSLTSFVLVFQYLVPFFIIRRGPEDILDALLPAFHIVAGGITILTENLIWISGLHKEREKNIPSGKEAELSDRILKKNVEEESAISEQEGLEIVQSIVEFGETVVREVMTPRPDIVAISDSASLTELRDLFREQQYSRVPVYRDSLDNIIGVVFVKDLVALPPGTEPPLTVLMRSAHFVPATKRASKLLGELQGRQVHMAIVVDEYGGTAGLVTVEDLLEEIVGEIRDEHDVEADTVTDEGEGSFVCSGNVGINDLAERFDIHIEREGFETVGGYLLSHLGRMPYVGEQFKADGLLVEVLEVERRRINKIRLKRLELSKNEESK
tara:strand:+ start:3445 stop:4686 length:1242 start_codon:yes stop_codon:yes gene_type:complete